MLNSQIIQDFNTAYPNVFPLASSAYKVASPFAFNIAANAVKAIATYRLVSYFSGPIFTINPDNARANGEAMGKFFEEMGHGSAKMIQEIIAAGADTALKTWIPTLTAAGFVTAGLPLIYQYVQKIFLNNIGKPPLALKQHKITYLSQLKDKIEQKLIEHNYMDPQKITKPIFKQEVEDQIQDIVKATNNIKRNNAFFQNVILYGPGGTGKTMIAEKIAKEAEMNYMMMSGGELGQFIKRGEHVTELNKLLNAAEKSSHPTIIFIDEAEGLCKTRNDLDQERLELQNTLLNRTGTPSKKIMIILATNRVTDIDLAILNRMTHKIHIDIPGFEERAQIIDLYANQLFTDPEEINEFFNTEKIQNLAKKTEKLSARSLFQIINMIFAKKGETLDNRLTQQIVDRSVDQFVKQEKELREQILASAPAR